ncbi:hypothetical protein LAZ67_3002543 [Cordylochernes scorpioides]|uniref:Uncharacterized protein n=1 Tax=Cordylochernes scorpioides TaxID=51811 RepID=A0ABY6K7V2_9ARAC|nr:hypothetical protein LAZ67_3002543 [Cordylochernes scorpioides]
MKREDYNDKITSLLNDNDTYEEIRGDPTKKIKLKISKFIRSMKSKALDKRKLKLEDVAAPLFKGLPKIHKEGVPLRPIVSGIKAPTRGTEGRKISTPMWGRPTGTLYRRPLKTGQILAGGQQMMVLRGAQKANYPGLPIHMCKLETSSSIRGEAFGCRDEPVDQKHHASGRAISHRCRMDMKGIFFLIIGALAFAAVSAEIEEIPRYHRLPRPKSRQDSGRQGTSKQIDHCLYRKMEQGREEDPKEPMESDPDSESGENTTFPKKETTLGRTQEISPNHEDVTPPPPVSDVLGRLTTTLHQLSAVTGLSRDVELPRYDGSYEAQSFFTNYDAQADRAQLQYSTRLRKPPNLLQAPLRVTNTRAPDIFQQRNHQRPIRRQHLSRSTNSKRPRDIVLPIRKQYLSRSTDSQRPRDIFLPIRKKKESATKALRAFHTFKGIRSVKGPISCYSLRRMIKKFEKSGSLEAKPRSGRPSTFKSVAVTVSQNVEAIETLFTYGEWSPRNLDLTPCDFWLWRYIESRVYRCRPTTLAMLKASIRRHVSSISTDMLFNAVQSVIYRLQAVFEMKDATLSKDCDLIQERRQLPHVLYKLPCIILSTNILQLFVLGMKIIKAVLISGLCSVLYSSGYIINDIHPYLTEDTKVARYADDIAIRHTNITDSPVTKSRQDSGRQGTSKQVDHCLYRKMEQGREEDPKEPMESDPDSESGENTIPKKETTLGRTQEIVPGQEDVTPPPPVSDVRGRLTTTLHQLSAVTGHRERWNRYDGSYEAQSFFTNYDAQADRAQLQYSTRLKKPPDLLQAPLRVTNTRAQDVSDIEETIKSKSDAQFPGQDRTDFLSKKAARRHHLRHPTTARTDENVDRVLEVLRTDRRLSIQQIADTLHMSTFVIHGIVTEDLQMRMVCAKLVPKVLTQDQKELRVLRCQELLDLIQNEPDFLNSVVTGDESWMFEYDPESKRQSCAWHTKSSPRPKKA